MSINVVGIENCVGELFCDRGANEILRIHLLTLEEEMK
jgi:hypothetical protein